MASWTTSHTEVVDPAVAGSDEELSDGMVGLNDLLQYAEWDTDITLTGYFRTPIINTTRPLSHTEPETSTVEEDQLLLVLDHLMEQDAVRRDIVAASPVTLLTAGSIDDNVMALEAHASSGDIGVHPQLPTPTASSGPSEADSTTEVIPSPGTSSET